MKLSEKQKAVIKWLQYGYFLYENKVTPGAKWSLGKFEGNYRWGSVNGTVVNKLNDYGLISPLPKKTFAVQQWAITELGKTIDL